MEYKRASYSKKTFLRNKNTVNDQNSLLVWVEYAIQGACMSSKEGCETPKHKERF
jgi:hypothetical protein